MSEMTDNDHDHDDITLVQTAEWRCSKYRSIPWNCEEWELQSHNVVRGRDLNLEMDHHTSSASLEEAAAVGCHLCRSFCARFLHQNLDLNELPQGRCKVPFFIGASIEFQIGKHRFIIHDLKGSKSPEWLGYRSDQIGPSALPRKTGRLSPQVSRTQFASNLSCMAASMVRVPTRLVDVGESQSDTVRLLIPKDELPGVQVFGHGFPVPLRRGVIFCDDSKAYTILVRCSGPNIFPNVGQIHGLQDSSTRVLCIDAPLLKLEPTQYREDRTRGYHVEALHMNLCVELTYDTVQLEPRKKGEHLHSHPPT
ncbi:hypothetical protein PT974_02949 [Cladobotryum mycophilum]|uniref:Uncharacterized protein n=1 Tax=Cladobotryum mycophilum TaxID=491253 RepID=A0ABR0SZF9_9HYPO